MSATDQMREMISQLMGSDPTEDHPDKVEYWEADVCRAYLLGCCPHEVLAGTRMDIGSCTRVHEPALRADFNRAEVLLHSLQRAPVTRGRRVGCCPHEVLAGTRMDIGSCTRVHEPALRADFNRAEEGGKDHYYDLEALELLERFFGECERKKELAKKRLEESQEELGEDAGSRALAEAVLELNEQIGQKLADAERLGEQGKVDESLKVMESLEELKRKKAEADAAYRASMPASSYQQQKLRVCEVCSAYLGIHDNDRRLADHFGGKLHMGFVFLREKLAELRASAEMRRLDRDGRSHRSSSRKRSRREDSRERSRRQSRSRERRRSHSRDRDRRRDRDRDRDRERRRKHSRSRSRSKKREGDDWGSHKRRHSPDLSDEDEDRIERRRPTASPDDEVAPPPPPPPPDHAPPPPPPRPPSSGSVERFP